MLSEKPWREESVLRLILVLLGCVIGLSLVALLVAKLTGRAEGAPPRPLELAAGTLAMQAAALVLVHRFLHEHGLGWKEFLGVRGPRLGRAALFALGVAVVVVPVTLLLNGASAWVMQHALHMTPEAQTSIQVLKVSPDLGQRIYFGVLSMVVAPVIEETIFRGILYPAAKRTGWPKAALFGTALVFAAIHGNLMTFVPLTFLAVVLTLLYETTDNLLAPILAHSFFNAANFVLLIYETELSRAFPFLK